MRSIKKKTPLRRRHRPAGMDGELFRRTFDRHPWAMLLLEPPKMDGDWADAVVVAVNQAGEKLMGLSRDQLTGKKWGSVRPEDAQWLNGKRSIWEMGEQEVTAVRYDRSLERTIILRVFALRDAAGAFCVTIAETDEAPDPAQAGLLADMERSFQYRITHDSLTGLLNREGMRTAMERCFDQADGRLMAAMFLDLDNFKMVNDMYGHETGDEYIRQVGLLLRGTCPRRCLVSRLSGDEFLIMDPAPVNREDFRKLAETILRQMSSLRQNEFIEIKTSVGLAYYPENAQDRSTLMSMADIAMYKAKTDGGNRFTEYADTMKLDMLDEYQLKKDLRTALAEGQLSAWYQPVVDARTGRIMSFETLVRWEHPRRGLLIPGQFIPVARRAGLLPMVDLYMIGKALAFARTINAGRESRIRVAVNVDVSELLNDDFVEQVISLARSSQAERGLLRLEIKEGDAARDLDALSERIDRLSDVGVGVALDDFGRSHSSMSLIGSCKFDIIKMNDEYTKRNDVPLRRQMLQMLMGISREMGFSVVMEGVETPEQDRAAQDIGCPYVQGHFIARPIPERDIMQWLARNDGERIENG